MVELIADPTQKTGKRGFQHIQRSALQGYDGYLLSNLKGGNAMKGNFAVQKNLWIDQEPVEKHPTAFKRMSGRDVSTGVAVGPCRVIRKTEDLHTLREGEILVYRTGSPRIAAYLGRIAGLATEVGGHLTNLGNCARECGTPYVADVHGLMGKVHDGELIRVDGSKGTVDLLN